MTSTLSKRHTTTVTSPEQADTVATMLDATNASALRPRCERLLVAMAERLVAGVEFGDGVGAAARFFANMSRQLSARLEFAG
jgi:hypothetical protein